MGILGIQKHTQLWLTAQTLLITRSTVQSGARTEGAVYPPLARVVDKLDRIKNTCC